MDIQRAMHRRGQKWPRQDQSIGRDNHHIGARRVYGNQCFIRIERSRLKKS
jgi:hypothetical protein